MISNSTNQGYFTRIREATHAIASSLREDRASRAALRRMSPIHRNVPPFWKVMATHLGPFLPAPGPDREAQEQKWAAILSSLAEIGNLHRPKRYLSGALASADVHEDRVERLLHAHGEQLLDLPILIATQIQSRSEPVDWSDMALLVLSDGTTYEDQIRQDIARHYYRVRHAKQHT